MVFLGWYLGIQVVWVVISYYATIYSALVDTKTSLTKAWSRVDVALKQRQEEIRKLLDLYREALGQDHAVFEQISLAKKKLLYAEGPRAKGLADTKVKDAMKELHGLAERSLDMKAKAILQLEELISNMEAKIAKLSGLYNISAAAYNQKITLKPERYVAWVQGMRPEEMFK